MYVLPLCFLFPQGIPEGYFFFLLCLTLVGRKGCKIHRDSPRLGDAPGWGPSLWHFSVLPFCLWGISRGFKVFPQLIVAAGLVLRMLPGQEGFCCTDRGVGTPGVGFLPPQVREWARLGKVLLMLRPSLGCAAREKWEQPKGHRGTPGTPCTLCLCWTCHSRGEVLTTQLLLSGISVAVPFGRGKTIKQADMNNLLVCLADSCQDQQSRVIYLSTCVISFFFPLKKRSCKCQWHFSWYLSGFNQ